MAKITVLTQGYARKDGEAIKAGATSVLIEDNALRTLIDPGIVREALFSALSEHHFSPDDIQYVLLTHYHPDHAYGAAWFPKAKMLDVEYMYEDDREVRHDGFIPGTDIAILKTPGHSPEHCSVAVPTERGMVVVAGDTFWWYEGEQSRIEIERQDPFADDQAMLQESRAKILKIADFIIPGHGQMFQVREKTPHAR